VVSSQQDFNGEMILSVMLLCGCTDVVTQDVDDQTAP